jgi:signal transduction histidine kinase
MKIEYKIIKIISLVVLFTGSLVIFGWFFDIDVLKSFLPNSPSMKFGTAISFVCTGLALVFIARMREGKAAFAQIGLPAAGLVIIMFLTVNTSSVIFGGNISLGLLFEESSPDTTNVPRPSIGTLVSFTLIAATIIFSLSDITTARKLLISSGIVAGTIGGIALLGHALDVPALYYDFRDIGSALAIHTATLFLITGSALILLGIDKKMIVNAESIRIRTRLVSLSLIVSITPIVFLGTVTYILIRDFEIISSFGYSFAIIGIVAVFAAGVFAYFVTRQIVIPIEHLKDTALLVAKGNLDVKARDESTDEIGQLAKTFNNMLNEVKKAAALQMETQILRQIDKDKEEFAAMISHELKTPLIPISGYAELFLDGSLGNITTVQKEKMHIIYENSIRLTGLIQDILDARKIELGKLKLDMRPEAIKEIVKRSLDIFRPMAEQRGATLIDKTDDIVVSCDPDRILQVLNNIISNAVKFVPAQHGTISINSRNDNGMVMIGVSDNGIGIPKEKQKDLFKKFYQVDKSLTRKSGGTGLGLAISRGIIESHGGEIWVESEENHGTTVYFTIPGGST